MSKAQKPNTDAPGVQEPKPPAQDVSTPELTADQKSMVLLHQRQSLTIQVTIHKLTQQLEAMPQQLNDLLMKFCQELKIDPAGYSFDLDNLRIIPKS